MGKRKSSFTSGFSPAVRAHKSGSNAVGADAPMRQLQDPYSPLNSSVGIDAIRETADALHPTEEQLKTNRWGS